MGDLVLVRHGETEWSHGGRHTSHTDVALDDVGRSQARELASTLAGHAFERVLSSPRARAAETARLAGFDRPEIVDDLQEWDYGRYEGRTTAAIRLDRPGWDLWRDGAPGGETIDEVVARVDRVLDSCRDLQGAVLLFAHAHLLRVLAARWIGLEGTAGRLLALDPASISVLGHEREQPVIQRWNGTA